MQLVDAEASQGPMQSFHLFATRLINNQKLLRHMEVRKVLVKRVEILLRIRFVAGCVLDINKQFNFDTGIYTKISLTMW